MSTFAFSNHVGSESERHCLLGSESRSFTTSAAVIGRKTLNEQLVGHSVKNGGFAPAVAVRTPVTLSSRWRCMSVASISVGHRRRPISMPLTVHRRTATVDTDVTGRRQRALFNTCAASIAVVQSRRDAERATRWRPMRRKKRVDLRGGRLSPDAERSASPYDIQRQTIRTTNVDDRSQSARTPVGQAAE